MSDDLSIPNPHVAKLREIALTLATAGLTAEAAELNLLAVEWARMARENATLRAAMPSAVVYRFPVFRGIREPKST